MVFLKYLPILGYLFSCVNEVLGWTVLVSEIEFQDICRQPKVANGNWKPFSSLHTFHSPAMRTSMKKALVSITLCREGCHLGTGEELCHQSESWPQWLPVGVVIFTAARACCGLRRPSPSLLSVSPSVLGGSGGQPLGLTRLTVTLWPFYATGPSTLVAACWNVHRKRQALRAL